jgi:hypothetical protein
MLLIICRFKYNVDTNDKISSDETDIVPTYIAHENCDKCGGKRSHVVLSHSALSNSSRSHSSGNNSTRNDDILGHHHSHQPRTGKRQQVARVVRNFFYSLVFSSSSEASSSS